ncbi:MULTISPECIES: aminotransferase class III-fold pyridoxal phosphate-dependent enzyme [unclassified Micromonospora]|uniref:aminotransferase class III-fold pyridoxal phosphate-dependent enzyme n=1 Tax=unclassified Micromonospora TaxID=2617518 RepID=UPI0010465B92|nr:MULTISPECIES: aminotransferase class III-fold pyridoxal phosphate-dependent enzyme [unclassified Micromonospora]TDB81630.1 aminotransferase class III-fold pyridoxal phosphate-dependent enzyme [Micromonospora sp. KC721]TDC42943.1 aminotransferase class III-fold pyridoxal phosphate-dependent enzyme [Micromonospora sp. KC213]
MTGHLPADLLRLLRAGRDLHLDHYQSHRLPYAVTGGRGVRSRLVPLDGPDAGREFEVIDASGAYGSACLGAGHETVRRALNRGVRDGGQATDEVGSLERARLLTDLFGPDGLWTDHFPAGEYHVSGRNSGSEGMELALRLVLESRFDRHTLRPRPEAADRDIILAFEGAWHGWTGGLVPLLNRRHYRVGLPALAPDRPFGVTVEHLPFGDADVLAAWFAEKGHRLLGVVVEPVQGDAGILQPPPGYLRALAELCRVNGALLVADEVLTFAKTGRFFAMADEAGPVPTDVTVIGKSVGMGALSLSMVIARRSLSPRGSGAVATSDLRPLACAVIRDGLGLMVGDKLLDHSVALGEHLAGLLRRELVEAFPDLYQEARGTGVMHGVELTERAAGRLAELREQVVRAGAYVEFMAGAGRRSRGLRYVFPTMRVAPPLITTFDEAEELVGRIADGSRVFRGSRE